MKKTTRICSIVLVLALFINMLPMQCFAEAAMLTAVDKAETATTVETPEQTTSDTVEEEDLLSMIVGEDETRRDEDEKHFRLSDGSYIAVTYGAPVHYRDEAGKWQEIDNRLQQTVDGKSYRTNNAVVPVSFSKELTDGKLLETDFAGGNVTMSLLGSGHNRGAKAVPGNRAAKKTGRIQPDKLEDGVLYEDVYPDVDIKYTAVSYTVKEQIIVKKMQKSYRYDFLLNTDGLTAALNEDGSVSLSNKTGVEIYRIPAPYMQDASGITSNDAAYTLTETKKGTVLTVEADPAWMNAAERSYPVIIDPTLQVMVNSHRVDEDSSIYATYVTEGSPSQTHGTYQWLYLGYGSASSVKKQYGYVHFNTLPTVPVGTIVTDAHLQMYVAEYSHVTYDELPLSLYEVTEAPSSGAYYNWITGMTWNNKPDYDGDNVIDYATASSATVGSSIHWDITELVKKWYDEETVNRTVAITPAAGRTYDSNHCALATIYGYDDIYYPSLIVSYRSNVGIEPYYTYNTLGAGVAGTAYIADQSGQLKMVTPLVGYASTVNPVSVNLVYNSDYFVNSANAVYKPPMKLGLDMTVGHGWNLDVIQKMEDFTGIPGKNYKKYTDGDGTIHYFLEGSDGYFYDEDGLGLKVKETSDNNYTMSDDKGNVWKFTKNLLTKVIDADNNEILILYEDGKLVSVKQRNNGIGSITVAAFGYSTAGAINQIEDAAGNIYRLSYDSDTGSLLQIKRNDTIIAKYGYDQHRLTSATDAESNYGLSFVYTKGKISYYKEIAIQSTDSGEEIKNGAKVKVTYPKQEKTVYRDCGQDRTFDTDDDFTTHYLFDYAGRTVNAYTVDAGGNIIGASNAVYTGSSSPDKDNNRALRSASIGTAAQQLYLKNTGIESTSSFLWTTTGMSVSTAKAHTGLRSLTGSLGSTAVSGKRLTETLKAGQTYTFSAYVNSSAATAFSGSGIFLQAKDKSTGTTWKSKPLTYATSEAIDGGWVQLSVTFTAETSTQYLVSVNGAGGAGKFYVDDFQVEKGGECSNYNMLQNGSMEMGTHSWTFGEDASIYTTMGAAGTAQSARIESDPFSQGTAQIYQDITVNLPGTQTYVLSGWANAFAVPDNVNTDEPGDTVKQCGLRAEVYYTVGEKDVFYAPFNPDLPGTWQFVSHTVVPDSARTVERIRVVCTYEGNANRAYFDNISLVREAAQTMRYDDDGNLESVTSTGLTADVNTYEGGNLIESVTGGYGTYTYYYTCETNEHRLTSVRGYYLAQTFGHADDRGNLLSTTLKNHNDTSYRVIKSSAEYSSSGNLQTSLTDTAGNTTAYSYSTGEQNVMYGIPHQTLSPNGAKLYQNIDDSGKIISIAVDKSAGTGNTNDVRLASVSYAYTGGNLTGITKKDTVRNKTMSYGFSYDVFGNMTKAKVGGTALASYTYRTGNGLLQKLTYGNGDAVDYTYDSLGRAKTTTFQNGQQLSYRYDGNGQLSRVTATGGGANQTYDYLYDSIGRLITSRAEQNGTTVLQSGQTYNANNQLIKQSWTVGSGSNAASYNQSYEYNPRDGQLVKMVPGVGTALEVSRDALRRLRSIDNGKYTKRYLYRNISDTQTTNQVETLEYLGLAYDIEYSYTYDNMGNIATISDPTQGEKVYTYDAQGQLLTEKIGNTTYSYTYDNLGNVLTANTASGNHTYTYGNTGWTDLLTAYDGNTITYDAIGNPTKYYNGLQFSWQNGRRLTKIKNADNTVLATYSYDEASGMRLSKTVDGKVYKYYYAGDKLMRLTVGDSVVMDFVYGSSGEPYAVKYNGTVYYYILNLQGDVVKLFSSAGTSYGTYKYDAWGNILYQTSNDLMRYNPLRYRGYVYDEETGLYYVSSRYYDPEIERFINADKYVSTGRGMLGYNMFAYCNNNPVMYSDATGEFPWIAVIVVAVCAVVGGVLGWRSESKLGAKPEKVEEPLNTKPPTPSQNKELLLDDIEEEGKDISSQSQGEELTTGDRIKNAAIGAGLGVVGGGAIVAVAGAAGSVAAGSASAYISAFGGTGAQTFSIGAVAYDIASMILFPFFGIEAETIEIEP